MVHTDRDTNYDRYSLQLNLGSDTRKPEEIIYGMFLVFFAIAYLSMPDEIIWMLLFWITLGFGMIYWVIMVILRRKRLRDAAKYAKENEARERRMLRQLSEQASSRELSLSNQTSFNMDLHSIHQNEEYNDDDEMFVINDIDFSRHDDEHDDDDDDIIEAVIVTTARIKQTQPELTVPSFGLDVSKYRTNEITPSSTSSDNSCSICLAEFIESDEVNYLFCSHIFHDACLEQWLLSNSDRTCPICRQPVASEI